MRIAVANWTCRKVGGAERYLGNTLPELVGAGHQLAFFHQTNAPTDRDSIALPAGVPAWCIDELGSDEALAALREWRPDLIFTHQLTSPDLEAELLGIAPAILFAHGYLGTCISGTKMFKAPAEMPCHRRFGAGCLLRYYPNRCGGLNPVTMLRDYRDTARRLPMLSSYRAIVTNSEHMRAEFAQHVRDPERVTMVPLPVSLESDEDATARDSFRARPPAPMLTGAAEPLRLVFLGRMDRLKGGRVLIEALPRVAEALQKRIHVTFAGDGPDRQQWEDRAARVSQFSPDVAIDFVGWTVGSGLEALWSEADLLVVPSLWPEPFGLVGPEAGLRGVPAAAFAVGGIPDWLADGVNGHLAPADPPTAAGLAEAIVRSLRDPAEYAALRRGAREVARRYSQANHLRALLEIFASAAAV